VSEQDIDLRKLRYFLAVAAESNFGRAAARLHMTQPALSRQIQSLETEVGVRLFERDRQGARLTPAGEQFRKDAEQLLELSVAAQRRARQAARPPSLFSVGFMPAFRPLRSSVSSENACRGWRYPSFTRQ
jgi:DNA-binding transcriptional LysR family regulator